MHIGQGEKLELEFQVSVFDHCSALNIPEAKEQILHFDLVVNAIAG